MRKMCVIPLKSEGRERGKSTTNAVDFGSEMGSINYAELSSQLVNHRLNVAGTPGGPSSSFMALARMSFMAGDYAVSL